MKKFPSLSFQNYIMRQNEMKKSIVFFLAAVMCFSLSACRNTESETNNDNIVAEDQNTGAGDIKDLESAEEDAAPEETPEAAFDKKWAGNGCEMPIPEPPFAYELHTRDNGVKISTINGGIDGDVTHSGILAYCDTLKEVGFSIDVRENVIGERYGRTCYEFSAKNKAGNSVELVDDGGGVVIFVYFDTGVSNPDTTEDWTASGETQGPGFDTSWASNEFEALLPKLPFDGWSANQKSDSVYKMERGGLKDGVITDANGQAIGYGEDKEALIAYLASLKDYGFSVTETGGIDGYEYKWLVTDSAGNEIEVMCAEGYCWITITKKN